MKKTLLFLLLLSSLSAFAQTPNYDSNSHIVTIPKGITTDNGSTVLYENIELQLNPGSNWAILQATPLDIDFTDADILGLPTYDLPTQTLSFPKVTVDNGTNMSSAELLLSATGMWDLLAFDPVDAAIPGTPFTGEIMSSTNTAFDSTLNGSLVIDGTVLTSDITLLNPVMGSVNAAANGEIINNNVSITVSVRGSDITLTGVQSGNILSGDYTWPALGDSGTWTITLK